MLVLFETPRLIVRQMARTDADALLAIFSDRETMRFYGSGQPWTRADVERMLDTYPFGDERLISEPGIALRKPDLAIAAYGGVGYFRQGDATADLFFIVKPEQRGQGLATEFAAAAITAAFQRPEIMTIHATVMPRNNASKQVLKKVGMRFHGYRPDRDRLHYRIDREITQSQQATAPQS